MRIALTIAGSDSCGGAGIQADLKTMMANGVYAMSAVTALTAQNTTGVFDIMEVTPDFLDKQLEAVFTDIRPDAVKIGMVSSEKLIKVIAENLRRFRAEHVVLDPVMVSSSGVRLMQEEALEVLKQELFPLTELITPNVPEAEILWGHSISSRKDMEAAALYISDTFRCSVLCKGGHLPEGADDVLCRSAVRMSASAEKAAAGWKTDKSTDENMNKSTDKSMNKSTDESTDKSMNKSRDMSVDAGIVSEAPDQNSEQALEKSALAGDREEKEQRGKKEKRNERENKTENETGKGSGEAAFRERIIWFSGTRIRNPNTHGTGCTLSSAIASNLAKGCDMVTSISRARAYLTGALQAMLDLGKGSGPLNHGFEFCERAPFEAEKMK